MSLCYCCYDVEMEIYMNKYIKLNTETSKEFAYRVIRDEIMTTQLMPGSLVSETELANFLKISRTPVREALMMLKNEHLIEVKPQLGSFVTLIDWNLIEQAAFMRASLEKSALEKACISFSEEAMFLLEKNMMTQELLTKNKFSEVDFHILDQEFHSILFKGINKDEVWDSIYNISTHYNRMRFLIDKTSDKDQIIIQHKEYIQIIRDKELSKISDIIQIHILDPIKHWPEIVENHEYIKDYIK